MDKSKILKSALMARESEILEYQINIDNYERAIVKIDLKYKDNLPIVEFKQRLLELLESSKTEQLKSIIIRDVIADQLDELEVS
jgi:hypothetical protein